MEKTNLKKLFKGLKNGSIDDVNDAYIDLFYKAMNETTKEEAHEIIYTLINALLYGNDFYDVYEELQDSNIIDYDDDDDFE